MSMLGSLVKAYEKLPGKPVFGYSTEKIGFLVSLSPDGSPAGRPHDLRGMTGKRPVSLQLQVPQPIKRTVAVAPNFLWDKTAYVLGVTAGEGKRVQQEHAAFVKRHLDALADCNDEGLQAFRNFLRYWSPEKFAALGWPEEMKDQNVVFALESDRLNHVYIHDRPAARTLWARVAAEGDRSQSVCLVTGEKAAIARLHSAIKGVWGAQSSGASIVSFNLDAFTSYGHEQGDNAPVSELAAFAYATALNRFLESGSRHRIQIGDASTVFWADASDADTAVEAESVFALMFGGLVSVEMQADKIGDILHSIHDGKPLREVSPNLAKGVRFYVLGLAPNAARLAIRFWFDNDFGELATNYQRYVADMRIEPPPRDPYPALWKYLNETATLGKRENVPPNLAGEWMRAILTGGRYPLTLLATALMRMRADGDVNAMRVQILKALLVRNFNMEVPVAFDPDNDDKGYLLGRLFALYELIQTAALGKEVNTTIKDKFYGAASAQPRKVFALLDRNSANHLSKLGKQSIGYRINLERSLAGIMQKMSPNQDPFPASLAAEQQALFGLGYYHQRSEFFKPKKIDATNQEEIQQ